MSIDKRVWTGAALALLLQGTALHAQEAPTLGVVLSSFMADSAVRTRGLPWTSGETLPVEWASAEPVAAPAYLAREGFTLSRTGTGQVRVGEEQLVGVSLDVAGNDAGVQRLSVSFPLTDITLDQVEQSLREDGVSLQPLKCDRQTEGAVWGNVVYVAKVAGKTASGLHENWNCGHDGCAATLTLLYRRADVDTIECNGGE